MNEYDVPAHNHTSKNISRKYPQRTCSFGLNTHTKHNPLKIRVMYGRNVFDRSTIYRLYTCDLKPFPSASATVKTVI